MFTQCPECGTVFRVTATVLRAAQGQVRCGVCDANFDALRFLTDAVDGEVPATAPGPAAEPPPPPPPPPPPAAPTPPAAPRAAPPPTPPPAPAPAAPRPSTPATRTTPSADEDRALAEIAAALAHDAELSRQRAALKARLEPPQPAPEPVAAAADDDVNVLEPTDVENIVLGGESVGSEESAETALEFNVPPGQWDRVFVAEDGTDTITPLDINLGDLEGLPQPDAHAAEQLLSLIDEPIRAHAAPRVDAAPAAASSGGLSLAEDEPLSQSDEYAMLELELAGIREGLAQTPVATSVEREPDTVAEVAAGADDGAINIEDAWFDPGHGNMPAEPAVAAPVATRPRPVERVPFVPPPDDSGLVVEELPAPPRRWRGAAAGGAVALALLLLVQLVHHNRDALGSIDGIGAPLGALYARLGMPLEPRWDLGAYDVKQWGAATDNAPGSLRLRASLVNRARRAQPYPLLRVTLEDRFGAKVARREFLPAEYLPGRTAPAQLLAPGARADADLSLADPGSQAVGFELDVCLKRAGVLICGTEPKAPPGGG